jgi:hypothetical protein
MLTPIAVPHIEQTLADPQQAAAAKLDLRNDLSQNDEFGRLASEHLPWQQNRTNVSSRVGFGSNRPEVSSSQLLACASHRRRSLAPPPPPHQADTARALARARRRATATPTSCAQGFFGPSQQGRWRQNTNRLRLTPSTYRPRMHAAAHAPGRHVWPHPTPSSAAHTQLLSSLPLPPSLVLPPPLVLPLLLLPALTLMPPPPASDSPGTCAYRLLEKLVRGPGARAAAAAWPSVLRLLASAWEMSMSWAEVRDMRARRLSSEARLGPDRVEATCEGEGWAGRAGRCGCGRPAQARGAALAVAAGQGRCCARCPAAAPAALLGAWCQAARRESSATGPPSGAPAPRAASSWAHLLQRRHHVLLHLGHVRVQVRGLRPACGGGLLDGPATGTVRGGGRRGWARADVRATDQRMCLSSRVAGGPGCATRGAGHAPPSLGKLH